MGVPTVYTPQGPRKLGRIRPKSRPQCLRFAAYYDPAKDVAPPPDTVDYSSKAAAALARMYLNDSLGDCVIAGKGHNLGIWTGNESGTPIQATDAEIDQQYVGICGPGDQGCNITDVLDYIKSHGFTAGGKQYPIAGYVAIDFTNKTEVQVAVDLFGALTIGINLPNDWTNSGPGVVWDMTDSEIVGGHDVTIYGYNAQGAYISTWGSTGTVLTWAALANKGIWVEEMYTILSPDWMANANLAPNGVDATTLAADLAKLGAGTIPPIDPTPIPTPTPTPTPTPDPTPTPTPNPVGPQLVAQVAPVTVTEPGLFGKTITIPGQAAPVVAASSASDESCGMKPMRRSDVAAPAPATIITEILDLLIVFLPLFGIPVPASLAGILAVIEQGLAAGMTLSQIIAAVIESLIPVPLPSQRSFITKLKK